MFRSFSAGGPGDSLSADQLARMEQMREMWAGPPPNRVPVAWPFTSVVGRSDDAAVAVVGGQVYPTGLSFRLTAVLRRAAVSEWPGMSGRPARRPHGGGGPQELLRFGVQFADGRSTETLPGGAPDYDADFDPGRPRLINLSGGGDDRRWDQEMFLAPLPPDGPLDLVCQWLQFGIGESHSTADVTGLAATAAAGIELWPFEADPDEGAYRPPRLGEVGDGFFRPILDPDG